MSPASYSAAACGGESPDYAVSSPPGVVSTRAWFGRGQRVTRDPPGAWVGLGKVHGGVCTGDRGSARRRSPERECSGHWNCLRDKISSAKRRGDQGCAHLALNRAGGWRRRVDGVGPAAAHGRSSGSGRCWRLRVPGFPWFASWSCCGYATGVRAGCGLPAASNRAGGATYRRRVLVEIRRVQAGGRGQQARGRSWARGGAPAVVGQGWEAVAWPVRGGAEARRGKAAQRRRLGLEAGAGWRMGKSRGAVVVKKGEAEIWACVPQKEARRGSRQ